MRIAKKKALTLFALTLMIVSLLAINMNGPTSAASPPSASGTASASMEPEPIHLHGPPLTPTHMHGPPLTPIHMNSNKTLTPVHMHFEGGILDPQADPLFTEWHELFPDFCQNWNLTSHVPPGSLKPNDQIDMTNIDTNETRWYHVDRMTWTMRLYTEDFGFPETIYVEYKGPYDPYEPITNPICTWWHEVWPLYSHSYHIVNWTDNFNGYLDFCDFIEFGQFPGIWWHVEEIATDIILREKLMDPLGTWWHEVYPDYCTWYNLTSWEDHGSPVGQLSPSDQIDMTEKDTENTTWYHVDRVTITINVTWNGDPTDSSKLELKTKQFEDMYEALKHPIGTLWHEVYPTYSNVYNLTWWDPTPEIGTDNCNGVLDPCDYIWLWNMTDEGYVELLAHILDMTYDIILNEKIMDPVCTDWTEVYPEFDPPFLVNEFHVIDWEDNNDSRLSPCDQIEMNDTETGETSWWHVDRVTLTLNVTILYTDDWFLFEYKGPFENMYDVKTNPVCTDWHMVWPDYWDGCFHLENWTDNCNGVLDYCDEILLEGEWCHVEGLSIDIILNKKVTDPVCTDWHELYPECCVNQYHIDYWEDNGDEVLSPCDNVTMSVTPTGSQDEYHVENVTLTLNLTVIDPGMSPFLPGDRIYIELLYGFEWMYYAKIYPLNSEWEIVCPVNYFGTHLNITYWDDNCNGVLSYCDNILLFNDLDQWDIWCHIDEVAVDMVVKKIAAPVHDVAVIDVFSLYPWVYQGQIDPINVTVENQGNQIETVDVYAFYDGNQAAPKQTVVMNPGDVTTLTFNWNTAGVPPGFYTVSGNATIAIDDDPGDNTAMGNQQEVRMPPPFYWKENFTEYAPSGMPDFDQKQDLWQNPMLPPGQNWTWCGPTAVGNSLFWVDSRFHPSNLLTAYVGALSEHDPSNVPPFIDHLAYLMDTDGRRTFIAHIGTDVFDMEAGIAHYLSWTGVNPQGDVNGDGTVDMTDWNIVNIAMGTVPGGAGWDLRADIFPATTGWPNPTMADNIINANDLNLVVANMGQNGTFYEHTVPVPDFYFIEEEVERCQDVVLLIVPYYGQDRWDEEAHFVTVAGIDSALQKIAFSDPMHDAFEFGLTPEGRVLPVGVPHSHPPGPPDTTHNNASLVSHDIYNVTFNAVMGMWQVVGYPGYNWPTQPGYVWLIEFAVITSPIEEEVCGVDITNITMSNCGSLVNQSYPLWTVQVNVTVHNNGTIPLNCTVNAYCFNATTTILIGTQPVINLPVCNTITLSFNWTLAGLRICSSYTVKANATCVCGASDEFVDGLMKVKLIGDLDNSNGVGSPDYAQFGSAYGSMPGFPNWNPQADLDDSCGVGSADYAIFGSYYGAWC